jgi:hypothetical protein
LNISCEPGSIGLTKNGIELDGSQHVIVNLQSSISPQKEGVGILRVFTTGTTDKFGDGNPFSLCGAIETLRKIKPDDVLIIPNNKQ